MAAKLNNDQSFFGKRHLRSARGATVMEYAILLGLVGVASIVAIKTMGFSLSNLLSGTGTGLETNNTLSVLRPIGPKLTPSGMLKLNGSGYYSVVTDSITGKVSLKLGSGTSGVPTNATSVDGHFNTLGSLMLANKLDQLAASETDPALKDYYGQIAKLSYYLGGAEGELDDVHDLDQPVDQYTNGDALKDVVNYKAALQNLLEHPPANYRQSAAYQEVMPLAADVYNIAQNYGNTLGRFIQPDGTVMSFGAGAASTSGNGQPGSVLTNSALETGAVSGDSHYDRMVSYTEMKALSKKVLSDHKVESVPVETTLTDATVVDNTATSATP